jgi:CheY-like chemotaxis protein
MQPLMAMATGNPNAHRVLVVDDNLDTAETLRFLLRDMGHEVEFAINGRAALECSRRFRPDLVFLDLGLPDFDGCELARLMKAEAGAERLRIIALTGRASDEDRQRARDAGCDEFIVKPLDPRFLESLLGLRR